MWDELIACLTNLEDPKVISDIWSVDRRQVLHAARNEVARLLHNFLSSAFTLVDNMRAHRKILYGTRSFDQEIQQQIEIRFANDNHHLISQGLRNFVTHWRFPPMVTRLSGEAGGTNLTTTFEVSVKKLLEWDRWSNEATHALTSQEDRLVIRPFATAYFNKVKGFYEWLWSRQAEVHQKEIEQTNKLRDRARKIYKKEWPNLLA